MSPQVLALFALFSMAAASLPLVMEPVHHAPQPYKFGYDIKDKEGQQFREESGNGAGHVQGSYGFTDARGVKRQVNYVADHAGFRAQVKTNEPGTANQNPAAVQMISDAPYQGGVAHNGLGAGLGGAYNGLGAGLGGAYNGLGAGLGGAYNGLGAGLAYNGLGAGLGLAGAGPVGLQYGYGSQGALPAYGGYYGLGGFGYGVPALGYTRYGF